MYSILLNDLVLVCIKYWVNSSRQIYLRFVLRNYASKYNWIVLIHSHSIQCGTAHNSMECKQRCAIAVYSRQDKY